MQGDFSRWTFDPRRDYRSVLLQQGRVLLDADWNEQAELTRYHDEIPARDIIGRAGGPADSAGFAITDAAGAVPADVAWGDLRVTAGRYYVDGILIESRSPDSSAQGIALTDQPYLSAIEGEPGLPEPSTEGRYAFYLDVWTHHVTVEEDPTLRESALGGPDTSTRARTVWQVRVVAIDDPLECSDLYAEGWLTTTSGTMTPALLERPPDPDPCHISESGGYTGLENQLYRVQIHESSSGAQTFVWSRENGSVVAELEEIIDPPTTPGVNADLKLDGPARDDELSNHEGDTIEVTSTDWQLRGEPGFLATAGAPNGPVLPVIWSSTAPPSLAALGRAPIVRRWEGPARPTSTTPEPLEDGIQVSFDGGSYRTGDYWLIPARTVRQLYGVGSLAGTIDWPTDAMGAPLPAPPLGPIHHITPLAIFSRSAAGWTQLSDCRRVVPSLNELVAIDLIGGDGQETVAGGAEIPEPIRVAVRKGGLPVAGAQVRFTPKGGTVNGAAMRTAVAVATDVDGVAEARWSVDPQGPPTQTLVAQRLNDRGDPVDVPVIATGRLSRGGGRPPGLHVKEANLGGDPQNPVRAFDNDDDITPAELARGITITLDGPVNPGGVSNETLIVNGASVENPRRPMRVVLELPWPLRDELRALGELPIGFRPIVLAADLGARGNQLTWNPSPETQTWLPGLFDRLASQWDRPLLGRFEIDGWAIVGEDSKMHLNGHANTVVKVIDGIPRTRVILPTDDEVTGGQFVQWFRLMLERP